MKIFPAILLYVMVQSAFGVSAASSPDETLRHTYSLAKFLPWQEPISLRNISGVYELSFPLADRFSVNSAKLHLELTNSNALIQSRSQLTVRLNKTVVAQIKLDPDNPRTFADIVLPTDKLIVGYNQLRFAAAQHYTEDECEVPDAPELWTEVDPIKSQLAFDVSPRSKTPTLASIPYYIDDKLPAYTIKILRPQTEFKTQDLEWGALIAQGVALRLQHVPFEIEQGVADITESLNAVPGVAVDHLSGAGLDTVIVGKHADIEAYLDREISERISGPYLGIFPLKSDTRRFLLVVSGVNDAEVAVAAKTFASITFPFPDTADTLIKKFEQPTPKAYQLAGLIQPDTTYSFAQLGLHTTSISEGQDSAIHLALKLPPDLYAREDSEVVLQLHLAYGAAMRRDSTLNISLNGVFQQAIHLHQINGAHYQGYRMVLPLRSFQPGDNTLAFHPVLTPLETGECLYRQNKNLVFSLFDDSTIFFPPADHYVQLPDLKLFERTGFPFSRVADGSETGVQLLDKSPQSVLAAWQITAKLAQLSGLPLYRASLSFQPIRKDLHLVVIGDGQAMQAELSAGAPIALDAAENQFVYPLQSSSTRETTPFWEQWLATLLGEPATKGPTKMQAKSLWSVQTGGLGDYALAMAYQSPLHSDRMILAITHQQQPETFYQRIKTLVAPEVWSQLQGDIVVWKDDFNSLVWQQSDAEFFVGETTQRSKLAYYFSRHPLGWVVFVMVLLLLFAWLTHVLLNRFKNKHHPNVKELES